MENHFLAGAAGQRVVAAHFVFLVALIIVLGEEDGFLGANLLAKSAEDAAQHVNFKILRHLLSAFAVGVFAVLTRRRDADSLGRADKFAQLAAHAFGVVLLIAHQIRRAAEPFGHGPEFLRIIECGLEFVVLIFLLVHLRFLEREKVAECDFKAVQECGNVQALPPAQLHSFDFLCHVI